MIDGIVLNCITSELNDLLCQGRIDKITQPEKDEILLTIRSNSTKYKLLLSAQASMPRIHLTEASPKSPQNAPSFCMLLRKYIGNGKIKEIRQVGLERIAEIRLEQLNELGDLCEYCLRIEIMGKHSNIILCDHEDLILDSIKRIGFNVSSVRQVYPNLPYEYPPNKDKIDLLSDFTFTGFQEIIHNAKSDISTALYIHFQGLSPFYASHLCYVLEIDSGSHVLSLNEQDLHRIYALLLQVKESILHKKFRPVLLWQNNELEDFHSLLLTDQLPFFSMQEQTSISASIDYFYGTKAVKVRMKQKTQDLRKLLSNALERCYKKLDLQEKQFQDTKDMEQFKIRGELILANQYLIKPGMKNVNVLNYYTNEEILLPLDEKKTPIENANKAFDKYTKKKRTKEALCQQIESTQKEIQHLESVKYAIENILLEDDIEDIRKELMETGYLRYRKGDKKTKSKSRPYHYLSSDGYHMYVGKNNLQNEELSLKTASNSDWWFHTKDVPGSHVILRCEGKEPTDKAYEEAAALAAYYSKARNSTKVTVDYTQVRNLKKPQGTVPGFVVYHTNYSLHIDPSISTLRLMD